MLKSLSYIINHRKYGHIFFIGLWIIANLLQSLFMELAHDEAYYWMYSKHLDFGYFDHPPMVALLIKLGYALFSNELGVRFFFVLMGGGTLFFVYKCLPKNYINIPFFYVTVFSILIVSANFAGFIATPDIPLVFFSALFIFYYKKYLDKDSIKTALILGVLAAAMIYSKYHAGLLIMVLVFANLSFFKRRSFYIIMGVFLLLIFPHLYWQWEHGLPTFSYHLIERASSTYNFSYYTLNYLYSQLLVSGPLTGIFILYFAFTAQAKDTFRKSLKAVMIFFFAFFFLMTFRGHVQAQWLVIAYIPIIVLSVPRIEKNKYWKKIIYTLAYISIGIFVLLRIVLATDILPKHFNIKNQFFNWDTWAEKIAEKANGKPVFFRNSYQLPSKYSFYTGETATTHTHCTSHITQYDMWNYEDSLQGKTVLIIDGPKPDGFIETKARGKFGYKVISNFRSYNNNVEIQAEATKNKATTNDSVQVNIQLINKTTKKLNFEANPKMPSQLVFRLYKGNKLVDRGDLKKKFKLQALPANDTLSKTIALPPIKEPGKYQYHFSIYTKELLTSNKGDIAKITITD